MNNFLERKKQIKRREKRKFDDVCSLPCLKSNVNVCIDDGYCKILRGRVVKPTKQPRSYVVDLYPSPNPVFRNGMYQKPCVENDNVKIVHNADGHNTVGDDVCRVPIDI